MMTEAPKDLLEIVLRDVAEAGSAPWYPSVYVQATGVPRDALDACLDQLRGAGLVHLTDWVQGKGQGYVLTPEGSEVLDNGRLLARLRAGKELPPLRGAAPVVEEVSAAHRGSAWYRGEEVRNSLLNPPRPIVTQILLFINIAAFLFGLFLALQRGIFQDYLGFQARDGQRIQMLVELHHELGTLSLTDLTQRDQWWRLLSHCFVHLGLIHLLMNMWVLYAIGAQTEVLWGSWRYLVLYLIAGLCGGVLQLVTNPQVTMGGASGALCGLLASMAVWVAMNRPYLPPQLVSDWLRSLMINGVLIAFISYALPRVSWAGHLGGAVGGMIVSVPLIYSRYGHGAQRLLGFLGVLAVPVLALALLWNSLPKPVELDPNDPAVLEAGKEYGVPFREKEKLAADMHEKLGSPYLAGKESPKEDANKAALAALIFRQQVGQPLDQTAEDLRKGAQRYGGEIGAHLRAGAAVLEAQARYFDEFAAALGDPANWNNQRREVLKQLWRQAEQLDSPWRESPVLRPG